ncbi:MAG: hypothetical protein Q3971_01385 [Moraxella sp.]|nr:hypothetical protein [Moraxella sp.]
MKTKIITTSAIVAMLAIFGTAHADTTKPTKADTQECKPPHDFKGKGEKPAKTGDRPEPPKDANGKPMPPKDGKKNSCPPPKDGQTQSK